MISWINGQPADGLPLTDRALAYGDGLFETMKATDGHIALLERHMQRLQLGCERLDIGLDFAVLRRELVAFAANMESGVCKLIVSRGAGQRGYALPVPQQPLRILQAAPLPQWPRAYGEEGIRLHPCRTRLAIQPQLAGLKHLNRLEQVLARAEWDDPEYAEGLLLDTAGHIVEGVFSNLFFVRDGWLLTPDLSGSGVAGIMRGLLLELAQQNSLDACIRPIAADELGDMDEVFSCNSLYGIWPVIACGAHSWQPGPLTFQLQNLLDGYLS